MVHTRVIFIPISVIYFTTLMMMDIFMMMILIILIMIEKMRRDSEFVIDWGFFGYRLPPYFGCDRELISESLAYLQRSCFCICVYICF